MGTKLIIAAAASTYTGLRGSGPVLGEGQHLVHIPANGIVLTDDSVSNPFGGNSEEKVRAYDDCREVIASRFTNFEGGITERFYAEGFVKYGDLTEAQKSEGKTVNGVFIPRYTADPEKGYAIEDYIGPDGKKVGIETGKMKADGTPEKRAAKTRVVDPKKSETACRILGDFMAACRIPVQMEADGVTPKAMTMTDRFNALQKVTCQLQIVVKTEKYDGKDHSKVVSIAPVGTAVATQETTGTVAAAAPVVDEIDEF